MNRYALALLIVLIVAGLVACGSADNDPALLDLVQKPGGTMQQQPIKPSTGTELQ